MPELRLIDPCGYDAVTDGYLVVVEPQEAAKATARLRTEVAVRHAAEHAYAGYDPRAYTVQAA